MSNLASYWNKQNTNSNKPGWIKALLEESEREAAETVGLKLLNKQVRCLVWDMAMTLGFRQRGVPAQACRLLERYFYFFFQTYVGRPREAVRAAILDNVNKRLMLLIACCIQLSVKMNSAEARISPKVLRIALLCKGVSVTEKDIIQEEVHLFAIIGFRVPLNTSSEIAEMIAHQIGMESWMIQSTAKITDVTEFYRNIVDKNMPRTATGSTSTRGIRTLHLCAGAVAATALFNPSNSSTYISIALPAAQAALYVLRIANLLSVPSTFISSIANIIIIYILNVYPCSFPINILKRKWSE